MPFVEDDGHLAWVEPELALTDEGVALIRTVLVCRLRSAGVSWRRVGEILNAPATTLKDRHDRMSPADRARAERLTLRDWGL